MNSARTAAATLLAAVSAVALAASIDLDGDGMADAWELLHGAGALTPGGDADGDHVTNLAESDAGTDPFDPESYLRFVNYARNGGQFVASWPTVEGKEYQLEQSGDLAAWIPEGIWRYGDGNMASVSITAGQRRFTSGTVVREHFDLVPDGGWGLDYLRSTPAYVAGTPDATETLASLQFLQSAPDLGWFGTRIRAYLIPPVTGDYTFHVASDDSSELLLSTDADPANAAVIAFVDGWTGTTEWAKYSSQASAPVPLTAGQIYFLRFEQFEGGGGDHGAVAWQGPGINFGVIPGEFLAPYDEASPSFINPDGPNYFRVVVRDPDSDNDGVADYEEIVLGTNPQNPTSSGGGLNDYDALSAALADTNRISVAALDAAAYEAEGEPGRFQFTREGNITDVTATFTVGGTATTADFSPLDTSVRFPLGVRTVVIEVAPTPDGLIENDETVELSLVDGADYDVAGSGTASLLIEDARPNLFVARPAPTPGVTSIAESRILFWEKGNRTSALIDVEFANLSSEHLSTAIIMEPDGVGIPQVLATLPAGLISGYFFDYGSASGATAQEVRDAIDAGRLVIHIRTSVAPGGELAGVLRSQAADATTFTAPATPPALPGGAITDAEAVRFLSQTTFGPTTTDVLTIQALGYEPWLDEQMDALLTPPSLHTPALVARETAMEDVYQSHRQAEWFLHAVEGSDQLRQRVAFALSEIFVVSDQDGNLQGTPIGLANYYDMLVQAAFGNYRSLLEDISLSPIMGTYLSHIRNPRADPYLGTNPDENYAREIMQLFSIGLVQLHPDGSAVVGPDGIDLATYNQDTITQTARVFTGWAYNTSDVPNTSFWYGPTDWINPMTNFPDYHDPDAKTIVTGLTLPAGQSGPQDLAATLDALSNHPNTGPFLARLLIQRLVTSNPSPGYIYRTAAVFNDDGTGTRGNLGAVVKAILLDYEARSATLTGLPGFGKPHEPLIRLTRLLRLFGATSPSGSYWLPYEENNFGQAPLRSPTVFNFFLPGYALPGTIAESGLVSPEFEIVAETTIISGTNRLYDVVDGDGLMPWDPPNQLSFDWQPFMDLYFTGGPGALVDFLDLYMCSGEMPAPMRTEIIDLLNTAFHWDPAQTDAYRVQSAVQIVATSPTASIQR